MSNAAKVTHLRPETSPGRSPEPAQQCAGCFFMRPGGYAGELECRRHAPSVDGFPAVKTTGWCGEFKCA